MLSFFKKNSGLRNSTLAVFFVFSIVGLMNVAIAAYTPPTCPPPGCNTDAPINVGTTPQFKYGNLTITSPTATGTIISDLLWTNYGAVINADGGGASGVGLLVPRDKVGIGFSGIGTDLPQAKLDVNGATISRGSLVVGTSTPSWATLDVNGSANIRDNVVIGVTTGITSATGTKNLKVYGNLDVSDVPIGSQTGSGYVYVFLGQLSGNSTSGVPSENGFRDAFPAHFSASTVFSKVRIGASNISDCNDVNFEKNCTAGQDVVYQALTTDSNGPGTRLYDLWADTSSGTWTPNVYVYAKRWTSRTGGKVTSYDFESQNATIGWLDGYVGGFDWLSVGQGGLDINTTSSNALNVRGGGVFNGPVRAGSFCVSGGNCFTSSTLVGVWERSTSTSSIFYDGGFVGIGTGSTPEDYLHIKGNASVVGQTIENTKSSGISALAFSRKDSAGMLDEWGISGSGDGSNRGLFIKNGSRAVSSLSLLRNGNVGIGTESPLGIFDVVGDGNVRLKPNSLSGRVTIGENGLVDTVINGNLSLDVQGSGLRYSPGADYTNIGNNREYSMATDPRSLTGADAWDTQYLNNQLTACDTTLGGAECRLPGASLSAVSSDPAVKYDLYAFQSAGPAGACGVPPNPSADPGCKWKKAAKAYNKASGSGGNLSARNGSFSEDVDTRKVVVMDSALIGRDHPLVRNLDIENLTPYGLSVLGDVAIGKVSPNHTLDVAGKVNGSELCINDDGSGVNCRSSWPTFTVPTSTPSIWQTHSSGTYYGNPSKYVGIGGVPISLPLTVYTNSPNTGWIQLKDPGNDWHITGFGGGFNITQTGVAKRLSINNSGEVEIYNTLKVFDLNDTSVRATINPADIHVVRGSDSVNLFGSGNIEATKDVKANRILANDFCNNDGSVCMGSPTSGYQKFPNGFIIQWGVTASNSSWNNTNFPIAFTSNTSYSITASGNSGSEDQVVAVERVSRTTFRVRSQTGGGMPVQWIAVGY